MTAHSSMARLRRYAVAGLIVWVPLAITFFVIKVVVDLMDRLLLLIPPSYRPETLLGVNIPGLGIVFAVVLVLFTGMVAANFLGGRIVAAYESLVNRIPLVRSIYTGAKQVAETMLSSSSKSFRKVLLVQYPRKGLWSLGFLTSSDLGEVQDRTERELVCVFVPTTPNPTSGFVILAPREDVIELNMAVDEALRMIISLGVIVPRPKPAQGKLAQPSSAP